jgi:hypothetical protein
MRRALKPASTLVAMTSANVSQRLSGKLSSREHQFALPGQLPRRDLSAGFFRTATYTGSEFIIRGLLLSKSDNILLVYQHAVLTASQTSTPTPQHDDPNECHRHP